MEEGEEEAWRKVKREQIGWKEEGMEGGRDRRRKGWEGERYRKEGMGVDGKEERKRQGKTEKKSFFMASPPSRLAPVSHRRT